MIDARIFRQITGHKVPESPVIAESYAEYGREFFKLYGGEDGGSSKDVDMVEERAHSEEVIDSAGITVKAQALRSPFKVVSEMEQDLLDLSPMVVTPSSSVASLDMHE